MEDFKMEEIKAVPAPIGSTEEGVELVNKIKALPGLVIYPDNAMIQYTGRIEFSLTHTKPIYADFIYAGSFFKIRFVAESISLIIANNSLGVKNFIGVILDGQQYKLALQSDSAAYCYQLFANLEKVEHELIVFKRQDACHYFKFLGIDLGASTDFNTEDQRNNSAAIHVGHTKQTTNVPVVLPCPAKPARRMEFFGDSITCGEAVEACDRVGNYDPENKLDYSNAWYAYSWQTARNLQAQVHLTSQGGISLLDNVGWFRSSTKLTGMESCYDKLKYNQSLDKLSLWDFSKYVPQVVVVALGQNDSHPDDYMARDFNSTESSYWRRHYQCFVERLMEIYPAAEFILQTSILNHDSNWDKAIEEVCNNINSSRVHHFMYKRNGCGTPGHPRIPEAKEMADELTNYIRSLGEEIWNR